MVSISNLKTMGSMGNKNMESNHRSVQIRSAGGIYLVEAEREAGGRNRNGSGTCTKRSQGGTGTQRGRANMIRRWWNVPSKGIPKHSASWIAQHRSKARAGEDMTGDSRRTCRGRGRRISSLYSFGLACGHEQVSSVVSPDRAQSGKYANAPRRPAP